MGDTDPLLEVCVDCLESIVNATVGGASRLEICSALSEGGVTPSIGLAKLAVEVAIAPVYAMIRSRGGDFVYSKDELTSMLEDVRLLKDCGVDGFVFGALTERDEIDAEACRGILEAAAPLPVTFHRAFDDAKDPLAALDEIRELGFARLLTSGQRASALEGAELIAQLVERAGDGLTVMPGAGIDAGNVRRLRDRTGAREFHASARRIKECEDGKPRVGSNAGRAVTDAQTVQLMLKILKDRSRE